MKLTPQPTVSANIPQQVKTEQHKANAANEIRDLEFTIIVLCETRVEVALKGSDVKIFDNYIASLMLDMKQLTDKLLYK